MRLARAKNFAFQAIVFPASAERTLPYQSNVNPGLPSLVVYIPRIHFRLVIELKRAFKWTDDELTPYLTQTVAYNQTDIRLGVLGVLDLSDRPPRIPHIDNCFEVVKRKVDGEVDRTALIMRVPGNVRTPSDSK